jgi:hypothetical protein
MPHDNKVSSQQGDWHFVEPRDLEQEKIESSIVNMDAVDDGKTKQGKVPVSGDPEHVPGRKLHATGQQREPESVKRTDEQILDKLSKSMHLNSLHEAIYVLILLVKERVFVHLPRLHKTLFSEGSLKVEALLILLATISIGTLMAFLICGGRTAGPLVPYKGHLASIEMGQYCVDDSCSVAEPLISGGKTNESHRGVKIEWDGLPSSSTSDIERRLEQLELEAVRTARKIMEQENKISRLEERIFHLENSIYGSEENQGVFKKLKKVENTCSLLLSSGFEKYLSRAEDGHNQVLSYKQSDKNARCYNK